MEESQEYAIDRDNHLRGKMTATGFRAENKIREDIYRTLGEESGIDLQIKNGLVEVSGMVDTDDAISWIVDSIRSIKGVQEVKSKLRVKPFNL
jgi:osmotically-inducible protein OsmY